MDNTAYKKTLKEKKIKLINALNVLGNNITSKLKAKNYTINDLNSKLSNTDLDYIAKYKSEKNKEFDVLKTELNDILKDVDKIIQNITND